MNLYIEISTYIVVKWYLLQVVLKRFVVKLHAFLTELYSHEVVSIK